MQNDEETSAIVTTPKGGLFGGILDTSGADANTRALLIDARWTTSFDGSTPATTIPYAFPTQTSDYGAGYPIAQFLTGFAAATAGQQAAVMTAFDLISSYTDLTFVEVSSGTADAAAIRVAQTGFGTASVAGYPYLGGLAAGDTFLNPLNATIPAPYFGSDPLLTVIHELGHALGLKHGQETDFHGALAPQFNDNEFSVMTYASYLDSPPALLPTAAIDGSSPQSYMMFDIAALQTLYGANFSKVGTAAVYTWDAVTGQEYINGQPAPDTGVTVTHKIFSTVWTEGATTTYDLSNFSGNQVDDLRPGHWLTFSQSQLADLNNNAPAGTPQYQAQGNIYNALLYHGNTSSEISTLITGSGNDTLIGNDLNDTLIAGAGNDTIYAGSGNDTISGGPGADTIYFSSGHSVERDTLGDMNGDTIYGLGSTNSLDVLEALLDRSSLIVPTAQTATISKDGASIHLNGDFAGGDFMMVDRGFDADAHTVISFVNYLPPLSEGVSVNPAAVNGIANQPFLTGDGSVDFTLNLKQAVSYYENTLGFYEVAPNGTIGNVGVLFSNTLNVPASQQTIDLGVPGNNESIGFFLIQNGFNVYGNLPANLSFEAPGTSNPANINTGTPPVLDSATLGQLTAAPVFHTLATLNPGGATQVLSGVAPGGQELLIGFEDLPRATGDSDFNDVVVGIHTTSHGFLIG
jgi:Ca2+-binding RTX toxin-like protein